MNEASIVTVSISSMVMLAMFVSLGVGIVLTLLKIGGHFYEKRNGGTDKYSAVLAPIIAGSDEMLKLMASNHRHTKSVESTVQHTERSISGLAKSMSEILLLQREWHDQYIKLLEKLAEKRT